MRPPLRREAGERLGPLDAPVEPWTVPTSTLGFTERQMKRGSPSAKVREVVAPAP